MLLPIQVPDIPYEIQNIPCIESKYEDYLEREKASSSKKEESLIFDEINNKIGIDKKELAAYFHHFFLSFNIYLSKLIDTNLSSSYSINNKLNDLKKIIQKRFNTFVDLEKSLVKQRNLFNKIKRHNVSINKIVSSLDMMINQIKESKIIIRNKEKEISFVYKNSNLLKEEGYVFKALVAYNSVIKDVLKEDINPRKVVYDDETLFVFNVKYDARHNESSDEILDKQLELEDAIHDKVLNINKEFVGNIVISWHSNLDC